MSSHLTSDAEPQDQQRKEEAMSNTLYIRYFIEDFAFYVCRDCGAVCNRVTGPWKNHADALLSLEGQP
jgi:hypothetical protein